MKLFIRALALTLASSVMVDPVSAQSPSPAAGPERIRPQPEFEHGPRQERRIALTFDAGGSNEGLEMLLGVLERENVSATFFLTGRWVCEFPAGASQIIAHGHVIGNHTWGHKDLTKLPDPEVSQEILRVDDQFVSAFGFQYQRLFRAPFGEVDDRVLRVVEKLGFRAVRWSIDTLDAMDPRKTPDFIEQRVLGRKDEELRGAIVLMHVGYAETGTALPAIIRGLRLRGFDFVPLSTWTAGVSTRLAQFRTSALVHDPMPRVVNPDPGCGRPFDDHAMRTVLCTPARLAAEHQLLMNWHRWTSIGRPTSIHHINTTKP